METHVKILAWFNVVLGALGVMAALVMMAGASIIAQIVSAAATDTTIPAPLIQILATVLLGVILVVSLPCLILGFGLLQLRPWARILGIVLAAINLLNVPFGTAISLYAFWVLLKPETEALFKQPVGVR